MDTLFADISEWQPPVDDSYPYAALSIRSNDGTYRDRNFDHNFAVARDWLNSGRLDLLIVYFVVRPNWQDSVATHIAMQGTDRPDVVSMIDAESWSGQIAGDHSSVFNNAVWAASRWRGTPIQGRPRRVIGYLNPHDSSIWPTRPPIGWVIPSYGSLPQFSAHTKDLRRNMIAHQYTNGEGYGGDLPEGYGTVRCDMNAANGRSTAQLRTALGIGAPP